MDKDLLIQNVIRYCTDANVLPTKACIEAGVGKSFISDVRRGKVPSVAKVADLAAYLGVTTSDLVGDAREPSVPPAGAAFTEFVLALEALPPDKRELVLQVLRGMSPGEK